MLLGELPRGEQSRKASVDTIKMRRPVEKRINAPKKGSM
jgi:hypothetical protein